MDAGDLRCIQLDVAASSLSKGNGGSIDGALLLGRVAVLHEQRRLRLIHPQAGFSSHNGEFRPEHLAGRLGLS